MDENEKELHLRKMNPNRDENLDPKEIAEINDELLEESKTSEEIVQSSIPISSDDAVKVHGNKRVVTSDCVDEAEKSKLDQDGSSLGRRVNSDTEPGIESTATFNPEVDTKSNEVPELECNDQQDFIDISTPQKGIKININQIDPKMDFDNQNSSPGDEIITENLDKKENERYKGVCEMGIINQDQNLAPQVSSLNTETGNISRNISGIKVESGMEEPKIQPSSDECISDQQHKEMDLSEKSYDKIKISDHSITEEAEPLIVSQAGDGTHESNGESNSCKIAESPKDYGTGKTVKGETIDESPKDYETGKTAKDESIDESPKDYETGKTAKDESNGDSSKIDDSNLLKVPCISDKENAKQIAIDFKKEISAEIALLEKQAENETELQLEKENFSPKHCSDPNNSDSEESVLDFDASKFLINFESMEKEDEKCGFNIEEVKNQSLEFQSDNEDFASIEQSPPPGDKVEEKISDSKDNSESVVLQTKQLQPVPDTDDTSTFEPSIEKPQDTEKIELVPNLENFEIIDEISDNDNSEADKNKGLISQEVNQENKADKENACIPKEGKRVKIVKITCDDLPKSKNLIHKPIEIPGEEIKGGEFTRVVIIGSTYLAMYNDSWPAESKIKPFFLCKNDLSILQYYRDFFNHPYLKESKKIFVLFVVGLNDIIIYRKYKAKDCIGDHAEIKFPQCGKNPSSLEFFKLLVDKMHSMKTKLEKSKSLSVAFSYIPKVNFIETINNLFIASRLQNENCSCCYNVTKADYSAINAQFNLGRESFNQIIFSRQLNQVRRKYFFEFLPMFLTYKDRKWMVINDRIDTQIDGLSLEDKLKHLIFPSSTSSTPLLKKLIVNDKLHDEQLLGKMCFRAIIIGESWLQPVFENWYLQYKIKPFFYIKDDLTLKEIKRIIPLLVRENANTLVITAVPSGNLFDMETYSGCKDHAPLLYPVPKKEILDAPLKHASQFCKTIDTFQLEMRKLRKHCKVVFMTCYPVIFEFYYKYLTEVHETNIKPANHPIYERLVDFHECSLYKTKMKRFLVAINSHLVKVNMKNGLHTCDIYSLASKLSTLRRFIFPIYVPQESPPRVLKNKLIALIQQYIESTHILYIKKKFSFEHKERTLDCEKKQHKLIVEQVSDVSDSNDEPINASSQTDKPVKKDSLKKEKGKDQTLPPVHSKSDKHCPLEQEVSKGKTSSKSVGLKTENSSSDKKTTHSSHPKNLEVASYPAKFFEGKQTMSKYDAQHLSKEDRYLERSSTDSYEEAKYPRNTYTSIGKDESCRIPHEVRYPLHEDEFQGENFKHSHYKYRETYRRYPSPSNRSDYHHKYSPKYGYHDLSWKRSRSPVRSHNRSPSPRYQSKRFRSRSRSGSRSLSKMQSRSKYRSSPKRSVNYRSANKRSRSHSPHRSSSKRDRLSSAKEVAVSNLWEIHNRECEVYRRNPEAHPDYEKVRRMWYEVMSSQGLNPYDVNLELHWREYWLKKIETIFKDNWEDKKGKCLSLLSAKSRRSSSSSSSSESSSSDHESRKSEKHRHKKKKSRATKKTKSKKKMKRDSSSPDSHAKTKIGILEESSSRSKDPNTFSMEELESRISAFMKTRPDLSRSSPSLPAPPQRGVESSKETSEQDKLVDVMTILAQMSDKFGALGMSLLVLHKKVEDAIKQGQNPMHCIDEDAKMLLELIGDKIKKIMDDSNLTLVQRAIIQEAHDRLLPFLESIDNKSENDYGLDLDTIAKSTLGMQAPEIVNFIKTALTYKTVSNVPNESLMKIYMDVKAAQIKYIRHNPPPSIPGISGLVPGLSTGPMNTGFQPFSLSGKNIQPSHSATLLSDIKASQSPEMKTHFLSLSMNEKIRKFASFHSLPFKEKSFLLSHLDELEKSDRQLAQSLRFMIMQKP